MTTSGVAFGLKSNWFTVTNKASFPYHVVTRDGGVFSFAGASFHGSLPGVGVKTGTRDIAEGPGGGYWLLGDDGGVFSFDVPFYGSMGGQRLNKPVVGMTPTATALGYWLVANDGGLFSFGDAGFFGSTGDMRLNARSGDVGGWQRSRATGSWRMTAVCSRSATPGSSDRPATSNSTSPCSRWARRRRDRVLVGLRDGGIFTFGDATYQGSLPERNIKETAVGCCRAGRVRLSDRHLRRQRVTFGDVGGGGRTEGCRREPPR